jgi:hypothetical protein
VPKENNIGMAFITYWPSDIFGLIEHDSSKLGEGTLQQGKDQIPLMQAGVACNNT